VQAKHLDKLPPKEQAAITARVAGKQMREKEEEEEGPQEEHHEEQERPAEKARVTRSGGSVGKRMKAKAAPKKTTVWGKKA